MAFDAPHFLQRQARRHGGVAPLRLGRGSTVLITDPEIARSILVDERAYQKGPGSTDPRIEGKSPLRQVLGNGLLTSKGEHHKRQRRLIQPAFHRERIAAYADAMVAETLVMLAGWRSGEIRDVHADFAETTLRVLTRTVFDVGLSGADAATVRHAMSVSNRGLGANVVLVVFMRRFARKALQARREAMAGIDEMIVRFIAARRADPGNGQDVLSWLLEARDDDAGQMTDRDVRDEVLTLLLAGHETSTNALSWAFYLLAQHPAVVASLRRELTQVLGDRPPTVDDLPHLHLTRAIVDESMRLYPPAWVLVRHTPTPVRLRDYDVPAHSTILLSPYVTHRDPAYWRDAGTFDPGRWLTGRDGSYSATPQTRHAFFPFGGGPRMCIGNTFAQMEVALVLATVAQSWDLERPTRRPVRMLPRVTLRPRGGMPMRVHARAADRTPAEPSTGQPGLSIG
jgi:cytochrome P450